MAHGALRPDKNPLVASRALDLRAHNALLAQCGLPDEQRRVQVHPSAGPHASTKVSAGRLQGAVAVVRQLRLGRTFREVDEVVAGAQRRAVVEVIRLGLLAQVGTQGQVQQLGMGGREDVVQQGQGPRMQTLHCGIRRMEADRGPDHVMTSRNEHNDKDEARSRKYIRYAICSITNSLADYCRTLPCRRFAVCKPHGPL